MAFDSLSLKRFAFSAFALIFSLLFSAQSDAEKIRLMAGNISSGNLQSYDPGHGARIFKGLKPDVVMIQEFRYGTNSEADIRSFVTSTFGADFSYSRGPMANNGDIPNGVISRLPILSSGHWVDNQVANRDFVWARIDLPGTKELWVISVHMLTDSSKRPAQSSALVDLIQANVPTGDYVVIGGDFNASSRTESEFVNFSEVVRTAGPYPVDKSGEDGTNASRAKPYDNVLVEPDLYALQVPVVIGNNSFANGLVVDTRVYTPIADISPALATDSGAPSMQHMAIVKDFQIPNEALQLVSTSLSNGMVGAAYSQTLAATGGTTPYAWSVTSGAVPAGLTLSSSGVLAGTPTAFGTSTFTVKVTDAASATVSKSFSVVVSPATLVISTASPLADGMVGKAYSQTLGGTGGTGGYVWSVAAGTLPGGITLGSGGLLSGAPTAAGTFTFSAKLTDSANATATKSFTVVVREPFDVYLASYGLSAGSGTVDSDGDGIVNLVEYLLGGDPTKASPTILPKLIYDPATASVVSTFSYLTATGSVSWKVQFSADLVTWVDAPLIPGYTASVAPGDPMSQTTIRIPTTESKYFMRLSVSLP
jgi:endonuclease/exonuclease/phosphatase family metal-dependent hydrolase